MSLLIDIAIAAESIVNAAWARAAANRERLRLRQDLQTVREETDRRLRRQPGWEDAVTNPLITNYRPDEPVAFPAAPQAAGIAFALIPSAAFDSSITGPFGEFLVPDGDAYIGYSLTWPGKGATSGLSSGYTNTVWGLRWFNRYFGNFSGEDKFTAALPPGFNGSSYFPSTEEVVLPEDPTLPGVPNDRTIGLMSLNHAAALASGGRFRYDAANDRYVDDSGNPLQSVVSASAACTLELIVRLGKDPPTATVDTAISSTVIIQLVGWTGTESASEDAVAIGFECSRTQTVGAEVFVNGYYGSAPMPSDYAGRLVHIAVQQQNGRERLYVDGQLGYDEDLGSILPFYLARGMVALCDVRDEEPWPSAEYDGPTLIRGIRYTSRALYSGDSFTPPTSFSGLA